MMSPDSAYHMMRAALATIASLIAVASVVGGISAWRNDDLIGFMGGIVGFCFVAVFALWMADGARRQPWGFERLIPAFFFLFGMFSAASVGLGVYVRTGSWLYGTAYGLGWAAVAAVFWLGMRKLWRRFGARS